MAWRPRKSIRLGKGVRINLSKKGVGMSAGVPGVFRVGVGADGRKRASVGKGALRQEFTGKKSRRKSGGNSGCGCLVVMLAALVIPAVTALVLG